MLLKDSSNFNQGWPLLLSGTEGNVVICSFLIHRFPFIVLPFPVCGRRAMKNRSSSPPLHVHVDENTPVHVHIKKGQKTTPAKCQVGARSWVFVRAPKRRRTVLEAPQNLQGLFYHSVGTERLEFIFSGEFSVKCLLCLRWLKHDIEYIVTFHVQVCDCEECCFQCDMVWGIFFSFYFLDLCPDNGFSLASSLFL